jgi:ectoine hydroxylase-related dioxygenase (phytanoyl-CoA dioxygenase family)
MLFDDEAEAASGRTASAVRCVFRIEENSNYLRELLHSALMFDLVRPLLGAEPVADGIQYIDKPPAASYEFPYHQDNAYMFYDPPHALAATLALDKQPAESGPIACLRGSQVLDILPHQPSGVLGASRGLVNPPDTATYPEVMLEMEEGDLLVHHANVIHRTGPNLTSCHRRNLGFIYHGTGATKDTAKSAG